jgi:hypothetical protein
MKAEYQDVFIVKGQGINGNLKLKLNLLIEQGLSSRYQS